MRQCVSQLSWSVTTLTPLKLQTYIICIDRSICQIIRYYNIHAWLCLISCECLPLQLVLEFAIGPWIGRLASTFSSSTSTVGRYGFDRFPGSGRTGTQFGSQSDWLETCTWIIHSNHLITVAHKYLWQYIF